MNENHKHPGRDCDGLCHLSNEAWRRYHELMRGGCPEHAYRLATEGVWA